MTRSTIWISYDLGVRGDYENLYSWLDTHGAKECGGISRRPNLRIHSFTTRQVEGRTKESYRRRQAYPHIRYLSRPFHKQEQREVSLRRAPGRSMDGIRFKGYRRNE